MKKDIQTGVDDPLVNITEFEDNTIDEGYGTAVQKPTSNTGTVSQAMIKRFNQHSIMVKKFKFYMYYRSSNLIVLLFKVVSLFYSLL